MVTVLLSKEKSYIEKEVNPLLITVCQPNVVQWWGKCSIFFLLIFIERSRIILLYSRAVLTNYEKRM